MALTKAEQNELKEMVLEVLDEAIDKKIEPHFIRLEELIHDLAVAFRVENHPAYLAAKAQKVQ